MKLLSSSEDVVNCIPKGIKFSPDGLCVLTAVGNELRLYNTTSFSTSALTCKGGDIVQSFDWYPHMNSAKPETCCFLGTSRDQPVHLYDAYTGHIRATYCSFNLQRDEPESPLTVKFSSNGSHLVCGGFPSDRYLTIFDINRPGKNGFVLRLGKTRKSSDGQKGLVSSLAYAKFSPSILAVGTYAPGSIHLYDTRVASMGRKSSVGNVAFGVGIALVGHGNRFKNNNFVGNDEIDEDFISKAKAKWFQRRVQRGVTQLGFCSNDTTLVSASRNTDAIISWDVRRMTNGENDIPMRALKGYSAPLDSNQRIEFHIDHDEGNIYIGGRENSVNVFNIANGEMLEKFPMSDVVNSVSVHKTDERFMAVSLGERKFSENDGILCNGNIELWK